MLPMAQGLVCICALYYKYLVAQLVTHSELDNMCSVRASLALVLSWA